MKNSWIGILLIVLGSMFLLDSLGVMEFHHIVKKFWPIALILVGIGILARKRR